MPRSSRADLHILGTRVDKVTMAAATDCIMSWAEQGWDGKETRIVVTLNPEIIMAARRDAKLARVLSEAALIVPDGIGVVLASRLLGQPLPERVPGVDLMQQLLAMGAQTGLRPFFLGARPEIIEAAAKQARSLYPGLSLAGWHHGYFPLDDPEPVKKVAASGADLLFVGMGADRELKWLYDHRRELKVPVAIGVGGSFDVLSGTVRRAPQWLQRLHLEWLYRLLSEPRRWRRQTALPLFVLAVLVENLKRRVTTD